MRTSQQEKTDPDRLPPSHKDKLYDGQHQPIVPPELWATAQRLLAANGGQRSREGWLLLVPL